MQVSATLIAAQQAAREARARLQLPQVPAQAPKADFAAALDKTAGFSPLPLRQTAPAASQTTAPAQPQGSGRLGQHVNIVV